MSSTIRPISVEMLASCRARIIASASEDVGAEKIPGLQSYKEMEQTKAKRKKRESEEAGGIQDRCGREGWSVCTDNSKSLYLLPFI